MTDKLYLQGARPYTSTFQPYSDEAALLESLRAQFAEIQISTRTLAAALDEVQAGTSSGSTLRLSPTGVQPGTYRNARITVGADGRVLAIQELPEADSVLPPIPSAGLVLKTTASGTAWAAETRELPIGGSTGQVLGRTASGVAWVDVDEPSIPDSVTVQSSSTIDVALNGDTSFIPSLRRSGVVPGSYTTPTLSVDEFGRVLSISDGTTTQIPVAYSAHVSGGASTLWRLLAPRGFSQPDFDSTVEFLINGDWQTGTQTRTSDTVQASFPNPVEVTGVRVTAVSVEGTLSAGYVGHSDTGGLWSPAFDLPDQPTWVAGESRVFTLAPSVTLTGDVTGTGGTEVHTVLSSTGVVAGTYTNATIQVDAKGRVTHAENGVATGGDGTINPDRPIKYLTFESPNGSLWQAGITDDGAWSIIVASVLTTEDGETITAENGEVIGY